MKKLQKYSLICIYILVLAFPKNADAQNYSITETVAHINKLLESRNLILSISNNKIICKDYNTHSGAVGDIQEIDIDNISEVSIQPSGTIIFIKCLYNSDCTSYTMTANLKASMQYLHIFTDSYKTSEKIANALRYIIDKSKKSSKDDPYASYSVKRADDRSVNINDLKIGMSKYLAFKTLNTTPTVDSIEEGYEVYKVKKGEQYFLYFVNNKLTRIDKGVRGADMIININ